MCAVVRGALYHPSPFWDQVHNRSTNRLVFCSPAITRNTDMLTFQAGGHRLRFPQVGDEVRKR